MLGRLERGNTGEAVVAFGDGTMRVVKPGSFVRCAVTGDAIPSTPCATGASPAKRLTRRRRR